MRVIHRLVEDLHIAPSINLLSRHSLMNLQRGSPNADDSRMSERPRPVLAPCIGGADDHGLLASESPGSNDDHAAWFQTERKRNGNVAEVMLRGTDFLIITNLY